MTKAVKKVNDIILTHCLEAKTEKIKEQEMSNEELSNTKPIGLVIP